MSAFREYLGAFDEVVDSPPTGQQHGHPEETSNGHGKDGDRTAPPSANSPGKYGLKTPSRPAYIREPQRAHERKKGAFYEFRE